MDKPKIPLLMDSILNTPLAILPSKLSEILAILQAKNDGLVLEMVEQSKQAESQDMNYSVKDGIAQIVIQGTLSKRMNLIAAISGGTSYSNIQSQVKRAEDDSDVEGIFYQYDTPGGHVDGLFTTADIIFKGQKPSLTFVDGLCASAGYVLASASGLIVIADRSTETGSLGTVAVHLDQSGKFKKEGVQPTVFASGRYKKIGNPYESLTDSDKKHMQKSLDYMFSLMTDTVSTHRNIPVIDLIDNEVVGGDVFIGEQGINAGLIDEILTKEQALQHLKDVVDGRASFRRNNKIAVRSERIRTTKKFESERRTNNMQTIKSFDLKSIAEQIQSCESLEALKAIENECLLHFSEAGKSAENWLIEEKVKSTSNHVKQLVDIRRRQLLAQPQFQKDMADYRLGEAIGKA